MKKLSEIVAEINLIDDINLRQDRLDMLNHCLGTNFRIYNDRVCFPYIGHFVDALVNLVSMGL